MRNNENKTFIPDTYCLLENTRFWRKNFDGVPHFRFDEAGKRYIEVVIPDPNQAQALMNEGWKVKTIEPTEAYPEPLYFIKAKINYNSRKAPRIYSQYEGESGEFTLMDENTVNSLQKAYIKNVTVSIRRTWLSDYNTYGVYVNEMLLTLQKPQEDYSGYFQNLIGC